MLILLGYLALVVLGFSAWLFAGYALGRYCVRVFAAHDDTSLALRLLFPLTATDKNPKKFECVPPARKRKDHLGRIATGQCCRTDSLCPQCQTDSYLASVAFFWPFKLLLNAVVILFNPWAMHLVGQALFAKWRNWRAGHGQTKVRKRVAGLPSRPAAEMTMEQLLAGHEAAAKDLREARERLQEFSAAIREKMDGDRVRVEAAAVLDDQLESLLRDDDEKEFVARLAAGRKEGDGS